MSLFEERKKRKAQERANAFIKKLNGKDIKDIEKMYLENIEFENNEIVLSYLFFNYKELIRILPLDFQVSRVNSNLSMFNYASDEAKEIARLKRELRDAQDALDVLKKAINILGK